jgi:predicted HicB family RNase H-like nuclease
LKTLTYKGYQASVEYEDGSLFVRVLHLDDLLVAECNAASDVPGALAELVESYLTDCVELGKEPSKPFSGTFNVRIGTELHRQAAMAAARDGLNLNAWVGAAVQEKLECDSLNTRFESVISSHNRDLSIVRIAQSLARVSDLSPSESASAFDEAFYAIQLETKANWAN